MLFFILISYINQLKYFNILFENFFTFYNIFEHNYMLLILKIMLLFFVLLIFIFSLVNHSKSYFKYKKNNFFIFKYFYLEHYLVLLISILGLICTIQSYNLISIYISVEIQTLAFYILIALQKTSKAIEASIKYFIVGLFASSIYLLDVSFCYIYFGETDLNILLYKLQEVNNQSSWYLNTSLFLFIILSFSLLIKVGVAPFHLYLIDVYEGAPTSTTLFISTIPKFTIYILLSKILFEINQEKMPELYIVIMIVSLLSIILGSLGALYQINFKRMLAYSSVTHTGFLLLCFSNHLFFSFFSFYFYLIHYTLMSIAVFGIIILLNNNSNIFITRFNGLYKIHPLLTIILSIMLLSMAGLPPFVGFLNKAYIIYNLVFNNQILLHNELRFFIFLILVFSVLNIIYYLRIIVNAFFKQPTYFYVKNYKNIYYTFLFFVLILLTLNVCFGLFDIFNIQFYIYTMFFKDNLINILGDSEYIRTELINIIF